MVVSHPSPSNIRKGSFLVSTPATGADGYGLSYVVNNCPLLEELDLRRLPIATAITLNCPRLCKLSLEEIPDLEVCRVSGARLLKLSDVGCPLFDVSPLLTPTLHSLELCNCIVSGIAILNICEMWLTVCIAMFVVVACFAFQHQLAFRRTIIWACIEIIWFWVQLLLKLRYTLELCRVDLYRDWSLPSLRQLSLKELRVESSNTCYDFRITNIVQLHHVSFGVGRGNTSYGGGEGGMFFWRWCCWNIDVDRPWDINNSNRVSTLIQLQLIAPMLEDKW